MTTGTIDDMVDVSLPRNDLGPRELYVLYEMFCSLGKKPEERATSEDLTYFLSEGWDSFREGKGIDYKGFKVTTDMVVSFSVPRSISSEFIRRSKEYLRLVKEHDTTDPMTLLYTGR